MISEALLGELECYIDRYRLEDSAYCQMGEDPVIYTYGTTPFSTFEKIAGSMRKPKRLVVLGSSIGWKCFYWNSIFPDIPAIGYEMHEIRHDYACYLGERHGIRNVSFVCGDMSECGFREGDLVWENNLCMDDRDCDAVNYGILSALEDIQIVSYAPIMKDMRLEDGSIYIPFRSSLRRFERRCVEAPTSWSGDSRFFLIDSLSEQAS